MAQSGQVFNCDNHRPAATPDVSISAREPGAAGRHAPAHPPPTPKQKSARTQPPLPGAATHEPTTTGARHTRYFLAPRPEVGGAAGRWRALSRRPKWALARTGARPDSPMSRLAPNQFQFSFWPFGRGQVGPIGHWHPRPGPPAAPLASGPLGYVNEWRRKAANGRPGGANKWGARARARRSRAPGRAPGPSPRAAQSPALGRPEVPAGAPGRTPLDESCFALPAAR